MKIFDDLSTAPSVPTFVDVIGNDKQLESCGIAQSDTTEYIEVGVTTVKRWNFLTVGTAGSGKSTFCIRALERYFRQQNIRPHNESTTHIEERGRFEKLQGSTKIIVTFVDTPGFGDKMNSADRMDPVVNYIEAQNRKYENAEEYRRPNHQAEDSRIHCCFYFFMPHRVTPLDLEFLGRLQDKVPIVPIIAKTDTLKTEELEKQLYNIHTALEENAIKIFDFEEPNIDSSWLADFSAEEVSSVRAGETFQVEGDTAMVEGEVVAPVQRPRRKIPNVFAVISGVRDYPWGIAREDNPLHSDTPRLHDVLFRNRAMQSLGRLQDCSNEIHEAWRTVEAKREESRKDKMAQQEEEEKQRQQVVKKELEQAAFHRRKLRLTRGLCVLFLVLIFVGVYEARRQDYHGYLVNTVVPRVCELTFLLYVLFVVTTHGN